MQKIILFTIAICITQLSCSAGSNSFKSRNHFNHITDTKIFIVKHYLVDCEGIVPMKCMVVNDEYFYDVIEGFVYEEGYHYTLKVEERYPPEEEILADGSSISYRLLKQISKVVVN